MNKVRSEFLSYHALFFFRLVSTAHDGILSLVCLFTGYVSSYFPELTVSSIFHRNPFLSCSHFPSLRSIR